MTLVERIRNAIMLKAEEFDDDDLCCMGAPTSQHGRNVETALARAAIEAMRTHFDQMSTASNEADVARGYVDDWLAAALEEKP